MEKTRFAKRIIASNLNLLKEPYKLTFAITYSCQSKCKHCGIWKKQRKNELKLDEIEEFIEKSSFISWFNLTGGEPFLRKDIVDIVNLLTKNSNFYLLNITTNGLETDSIISKIEEMLSLKIPRMITVVSLDGPKDINDYIRGIPGSYDKVIQTYRSLRNLSKENKNFQTFLGYTITPWNLGKIEDAFSSVREIIHDIEAKDFHFNLFHVSKHYYENENSNNSLPKKDVIEDLKTIEKIKNFSLNPIQFIAGKYIKFAKDFIKTDKTPLPCKVIQSSCFLDPEGNVFPCTIFDKKLGNIRDFDYELMRILNSEFSKKVRMDVSSLNCPNCWTPCEAYQNILGNLVV